MLNTQSSKNLQELIAKSDIIICAIKPHAFPKLAREIAPYCQSKIIISVMASVKMQDIQAHLGCTKIARAMPNINAMIGKSTTTLIHSEHILLEESLLITEILTSIGSVTTVQNEEAINIATSGLSSTPGIIGEFMHQLSLYIQRMGVSEEKAISLTNEVFMNTAIYTSKMGLSGKELQSQVATKGGTTEMALSVLTQYNFPVGLQEALQAAEQRAAELSSKS